MKDNILFMTCCLVLIFLIVLLISQKSNNNYKNENFSVQGMPNLDTPETDIQDCGCRWYYEDQTKSWKDNFDEKTRDKCREYLKIFLENYKDVCHKTVAEYINWCHSYRRRLYMFPKLKHAEEKFKLFHDVNNTTY